MHNQIPHFNSGRILKKEMLENLRDYPRDCVDIIFTERSDGILYGLEPIVKEGNLYIKRGMLKYKGTVYIIAEDVLLELNEDEQEKVIIIQFKEKEINHDFDTVIFKLKIINKTEYTEENSFKIGTFELKKGAVLRTEYKDLEDFTTKVNTVNIVDTIYSGKEHQTISPRILKYFAGEVFKLKSNDPFDLSFCTTCLQSDYMEYQLIQFYLAYKSNTEIKEYTNNEIHRELIYIIKELARNNAGNKGNPVNRRMMTIVD